MVAGGSTAVAASSAPSERRVVARRITPEGPVLGLRMGNPNCALIRDKGLHCWGYVPQGVPIVAFQRAPVRMAGIDHAVDTRRPAGSINQEHANAPEVLWLHEDGRLRFTGLKPPELLGDVGEVVQFDDRLALTPTGALLCLDKRCELPSISGPARRFSSSGYVTGCAVLEGGEIECWGSNGNSVVDPGGETRSPAGVPRVIKRARIRGVEDAVDVVAGSEHACALRKDGTVWCWGSGYQGNLGDGRGGDPRGPVRVPGIDDAEQIATDEDAWTTCAIRKGGRLTCWGWSGEWFDREKIMAGPVDIADAKDVTLVGVAKQWLCFATKAGEVRCAGLSHIVDDKGKIIPGGPGPRKDAWYGKSPTELRTVLRASDVRAQ